jgi:hypothetical protein
MAKGPASIQQKETNVRVGYLCILEDSEGKTVRHIISFVIVAEWKRIHYHVMPTNSPAL